VIIVKWRGEWLRSRYDALTGALRSCLPGWTWPEPAGGLSLWVRLPGQADTSTFAQAALRQGVALVPGRLLSAGTQASGHVRLAFTQPPDVLQAAARSLAAITGP
jgi:DNA-binding transcriptional MocR family regulator